MTNNNSFLYFPKIIIQIIWEILYFPVWWYTKGLFGQILGVKNFLINKERSLALIVWIKNIYKPMYGQFDWSGIIISFFVRIFQIIVRSFVWFVWFLLGLFFIILWLILPIIVAYQIIYQIF